MYCVDYEEYKFLRIKICGLVVYFLGTQCVSNGYNEIQFKTCWTVQLSRKSPRRHYSTLLLECPFLFLFLGQNKLILRDKVLVAQEADFYRNIVYSFADTFSILFRFLRLL